MSNQLPRLVWADSGETPVALAEVEWNRFFLFARDGAGMWKVMSAPMTAHDSGDVYAKRLDGTVADWAPVKPAFNTWLSAEYAELTGETA